MSETERTIKLPCIIISEMIGLALQEKNYTEAASLEALYVKQCEPKKKLNRAELAVPVGARASVRFVGGAAYLNLVNAQGNPVTVILGGGDGELITIDGNGVIRVLPPEGPGDPEVRQAAASILQAINILTGAAAAGSAST